MSGSARAAEHRDAAPDDGAGRSDRHARGGAVRRAEFDEAVTEALSARAELQLLRTQEQVQTLLVDVAAGDAKPSVEFNGSYGFAVRRPKNLFDPGFCALVGGDQCQGAAVRRQAHGRPRGAGARAAQYRDAADCRARESGSARRAVGIRRARACEPDDSGGRAQRRPRRAGRAR